MKPACRSACSAVVHNGCNFLEQPFVRAVIQVHDLVIGALCLGKPAPSLGYECAHAGSLDGFENKLRHLVGLFYDDASKADAYWRWTLAQEAIEFIGRVVPGRIPEEEATDIFGWQAALACNWNGVLEKIEAEEGVGGKRKESHLYVQASQKAWEPMTATSNM